MSADDPWSQSDWRSLARPRAAPSHTHPRPPSAARRAAPPVPPHMAGPHAAPFRPSGPGRPLPPPSAQIPRSRAAQTRRALEAQQGQLHGQPRPPEWRRLERETDEYVQQMQMQAQQSQQLHPQQTQQQSWQQQPQQQQQWLPAPDQYGAPQPAPQSYGWAAPALHSQPHHPQQQQQQFSPESAPPQAHWPHQPRGPSAPLASSYSSMPLPPAQAVPPHAAQTQPHSGSVRHLRPASAPPARFQQQHQQPYDAQPAPYPPPPPPPPPQPQQQQQSHNQQFQQAQSGGYGSHASPQRARPSVAELLGGGAHSHVAAPPAASRSMYPSASAAHFGNGLAPAHGTHYPPPQQHEYAHPVAEQCDEEKEEEQYWRGMDAQQQQQQQQQQPQRPSRPASARIGAHRPPPPPPPPPPASRHEQRYAAAMLYARRPPSHATAASGANPAALGSRTGTGGGARRPASAARPSRSNAASGPVVGATAHANANASEELWSSLYLQRLLQKKESGVAEATFFERSSGVLRNQAPAHAHSSLYASSSRSARRTGWWQPPPNSELLSSTPSAAAAAAPTAWLSPTPLPPQMHEQFVQEETAAARGTGRSRVFVPVESERILQEQQQWQQRQQQKQLQQQQQPLLQSGAFSESHSQPQQQQQQQQLQFGATQAFASTPSPTPAFAATAPVGPQYPGTPSPDSSGAAAGSNGFTSPSSLSPLHQALLAHFSQFSNLYPGGVVDATMVSQLVEACGGAEMLGSGRELMAAVWALELGQTQTAQQRRSWEEVVADLSRGFDARMEARYTQSKLVQSFLQRGGARARLVVPRHGGAVAAAPAPAGGPSAAWGPEWTPVSLPDTLERILAAGYAGGSADGGGSQPQASHALFHLQVLLSGGGAAQPPFEALPALESALRAARDNTLRSVRDMAAWLRDPRLCGLFGPGPSPPHGGRIFPPGELVEFFVALAPPTAGGAAELAGELQGLDRLVLRGQEPPVQDLHDLCRAVERLRAHGLQRQQQQQFHSPHSSPQSSSHQQQQQQQQQRFQQSPQQSQRGQWPPSSPPPPQQVSSSPPHRQSSFSFPQIRDEDDEGEDDEDEDDDEEGEDEELEAGERFEDDEIMDGEDEFVVERREDFDTQQQRHQQQRNGSQQSHGGRGHPHQHQGHPTQPSQPSQARPASRQPPRPVDAAVPASSSDPLALPDSDAENEAEEEEARDAERENEARRALRAKWDAEAQQKQQKQQNQPRTEATPAQSQQGTGHTKSAIAAPIAAAPAPPAPTTAATLPSAPAAAPSVSVAPAVAPAAPLAPVAPPAPVPVTQFNPGPSCRTAAEFAALRAKLREYGTGRLRAELLAAGWLVPDADARGGARIASAASPFNPFARMVSGALPSPHGDVLSSLGLGGPDTREWMLARNKPELEASWASSDANMVGRAGMAPRHHFLLLRDLSEWTRFNVATLGISGGARELLESIRLLDSLGRVASEYSRRAHGWHGDAPGSLGVFLHAYPFTGVHAFHAHVVDLVQTGPSLAAQGHKNLALRDARAVLLAELRGADPATARALEEEAWAEAEAEALAAAAADDQQQQQQLPPTARRDEPPAASSSVPADATPASADPKPTAQPAAAAAFSPVESASASSAPVPTAVPLESSKPAIVAPPSSPPPAATAASTDDSASSHTGAAVPAAAVAIASASSVPASIADSQPNSKAVSALSATAASETTTTAAITEPTPPTAAPSVRTSAPASDAKSQAPPAEPQGAAPSASSLDGATEDALGPVAPVSATGHDQAGQGAQVPALDVAPAPAGSVATGAPAVVAEAAGAVELPVSPPQKQPQEQPQQQLAVLVDPPSAAQAPPLAVSTAAPALALGTVPEEGPMSPARMALPTESLVLAEQTVEATPVATAATPSRPDAAPHAVASSAAGAVSGATGESVKTAVVLESSTVAAPVPTSSPAPVAAAAPPATPVAPSATAATAAAAPIDEDSLCELCEDRVASFSCEECNLKLCGPDPSRSLPGCDEEMHRALARKHHAREPWSLEAERAREAEAAARPVRAATMFSLATPSRAPTTASGVVIPALALAPLLAAAALDKRASGSGFGGAGGGSGGPTIALPISAPGSRRASSKSLSMLSPGGGGGGLGGGGASNGGSGATSPSVSRTSTLHSPHWSALARIMASSPKTLLSPSPGPSLSPVAGPLSSAAATAAAASERDPPSTSRKAPVCDICDEEPSTVHCATCKMFLCAEDDAQIHRPAAKQSHVRKPAVG